MCIDCNSISALKLSCLKRLTFNLDFFVGTPPDFPDCYCENGTCIVRGRENENSTESVPASAPSMMDEVETNTRPTVGWCEADGCDQLSV